MIAQRLALVVVALVGVSSACTSSTSGAPTPTSSDVVIINGTAVPRSSLGGLATPSASSASMEEALRATLWRLSNIDGKAWPVGNAKDVFLRFDRFPPHQLEGFSGCNQFGGHWVLNDGKLDARLGTNQIGCHGPNGWIEERLYAVLKASPALILSDDQLALTALPGDLVFSKA
jgi:heat shock protein HslJ